MEALSKGCWIKDKGGWWMGLGKGLDSWSNIRRLFDEHSIASTPHVTWSFLGHQTDAIKYLTICQHDPKIKHTRIIPLELLTKYLLCGTLWLFY